MTAGLLFRDIGDAHPLKWMREQEVAMECIKAIPYADDEEGFAGAEVAN